MRPELKLPTSPLATVVLHFQYHGGEEAFCPFFDRAHPAWSRVLPGRPSAS